MNEFVEYLSEVFEPFGSITIKSMFGGYGVYHEGVMFGLVADDELYLKADNSTRHLFEETGSTPFEYIKQGKTIKMSYYLAPADIFESEDAARLWATRAFVVAKSAKKKSKVNQEPPNSRR